MPDPTSLAIFGCDELHQYESSPAVHLQFWESQFHNATNPGIILLSSEVCTLLTPAAQVDARINEQQHSFTKRSDVALGGLKALALSLLLRTNIENQHSSRWTLSIGTVEAREKVWQQQEGLAAYPVQVAHSERFPFFEDELTIGSEQWYSLGKLALHRQNLSYHELHAQYGYAVSTPSAEVISPYLLVR